MAGTHARPRPVAAVRRARSADRAPRAGPAGRAARIVLALAAAGLIAAGCNDSTAPDRTVIAGVDLDSLFAPPTASEMEAVLADWAARDVSAREIEVLDEDAVEVGGLAAVVRVVAHDVGGVRHVGAMLSFEGQAPASAPVLLIAHGGDSGINLDGFISFLPLIFGSEFDDFVYVAPAFRSEPLIYDGVEYLAEGEPSPWDRDVDDALALIHVALELVPEADPARTAVLGFSRGAGVGLLMSVRDPAIDAVVEFFGPTDFFGPFVRQVVEEALRGEPRDLPGLDYLNATFIQPLAAGDLTIEDVRPEILRRSPVYFVDRLADVQIHHGTADSIVPVEQAEALIEAMREAGRVGPGFEFYLYEGAGHDPLEMPNSFVRAADFLERLLDAPPASSVARGHMRSAR